MSAFTNWFKGIAYRLAPSQFTQTSKVELAKSSSSRAIRIFSDQNPEDLTENFLNIDQVLEVVEHHYLSFKKSIFLSQMREKILIEVKKQNKLHKDKLSLNKYFHVLSHILNEASLLSMYNRCDPYNVDTQQKLLKLMLIIAPDCFSTAEKITIAKQYVDLADFIFFEHRNKINNNLLSDEQHEIIRFYTAPENRNKAANKTFVDKLKHINYLLLDADENLADLYLSHDLLNPVITIRTALLHSEKLLSKHWMKVKSALQHNADGQSAREDFLWWLNETSSALENNRVRADKKENLKKIFDETLLLVYQDNDLTTYLTDDLKEKAALLSSKASDASIESISSASDLSLSKSGASTSSLDNDQSPRSSVPTSPPRGDQSLSSTPVAAEQTVSQNSAIKIVATPPLPDVKQQVLTELIITGFKQDNAIFKKLATIRNTSQDKNTIDQILMDLAIDPQHQDIARAVTIFLFTPINKDTAAKTPYFTIDALNRLFNHYQADSKIITKMIEYFCSCKEFIKTIQRSTVNTRSAEENLNNGYQLALENKAFAEMLFSSYSHAKILLNYPGVVKTAILLGKKHGEDFVKRHIATLAPALSEFCEHEAFFSDGNLAYGNNSQHSTETVPGHDLFGGLSDNKLSRPPLAQLLCETLVLKAGPATPKNESNQNMIRHLIKTVKETTTNDPNCSVQIVDIQFNPTTDPAAKDVVKTKVANALGCTAEALDQSLLVFMDKNDFNKTCEQLEDLGIEKNEYEMIPVLSHANIYSASEQSLQQYSHKSTLLYAQPNDCVYKVNTTSFTEVLSDMFANAFNKLKQVKSFMESIAQSMSAPVQETAPYFGPIYYNPSKDNSAPNVVPPASKSVGFFPTVQQTSARTKIATSTTGAQLASAKNNSASGLSAELRRGNAAKNNNTSRVSSNFRAAP